MHAYGLEIYGLEGIKVLIRPIDIIREDVEESSQSGLSEFDISSEDLPESLS